MSLIYSMNYNYLLIFSCHIIDIWTLSICYCNKIMALFLKIIIWAYKQKIKPYLNVCQSFLQAYEYNSLKIICLFRSTHIAQKKNVRRHKKKCEVQNCVNFERRPFHIIWKLLKAEETCERYVLSLQKICFY